MSAAECEGWSVWKESALSFYYVTVERYKVTAGGRDGKVGAGYAHHTNFLCSLTCATKIGGATETGQGVGVVEEGKKPKIGGYSWLSRS